MRSLKDKVVAITGAGSGIGRALAELAASRGALLALSDIHAANLEQTGATCRALGARVTTTALDVANRAAVHAWADATVRELGRVNVIVNNAGVAVAATVEKSRYEDIEWLMGINFWGVVHGTKAFLPHLKASGDGHVVNVSSVFGLIGVPTQSAYNASKFAVRGFTEALREELDIERCGVSATCVHPGGIRTNIANAARVGDTAGIGGAPTPEQAAADFNKMLRIPPAVAAKKILDGVQRNARRVLIGPEAYLFDAMQRSLPASYQFLVATGGRLTRR